MLRDNDLAELEEPVRKMMLAAELGDVEALRTMLAASPELVNDSAGYFTPIHFAVRSGHLEAVRVLLSHGADVTRNPLGWSDDPLTKAEDRGLSEIAALLERHLAERHAVSPVVRELAEWIKAGDHEKVLGRLDRHPDMTRLGDERGNTLLHWAVLARDLPMIDSLLERGAELSTQRIDGATPLQVAIDGDYWFRSGRDAKAERLRNKWFLAGYLIARGAEYDVWTAAAAGDTERVAQFVHKDRSFIHARNWAGKTVLRYASEYGNTATVRFLLKQGADPNAPEVDAPSGGSLWAAAKGNYVECAECLLQSGANPNSAVDAGGNSLFIATRGGHEQLVRLLYAHGASMTLDMVCSLGRIDLASEIIAANPSLVHTGGDYGPLCMAVDHGDRDLIKLLLRKGADLNAPWFSNNYMGYALRSGPDMVKFLLESGADPNHANWLGITYLHKASWLGDTASAQWLLASGADLNAIDDEYRSTPLGWAAKYGQEEMVRFLLDQGADPRLPVQESWARPLSWAMRKGYTAIAEMLRLREV